MDKSVDMAVLASHLRTLRGGMANEWAIELARGIREYPGFLMDKLVEAGVLEKVGDHYRIVKPHVHEWKVTGGPYKGYPDLNGLVEVWCRCGRLECVENQLPLEVPND